VEGINNMNKINTAFALIAVFTAMVFSIVPFTGAEAITVYPDNINKVGISSVIVPPDYLSAVPLSTRQVRLTWVDNSDSEIKFNIERKTGRSDYFKIDSVGNNVTTYTDKNLNPGTTYYYRIVTVGLGSNIAYSGEISVTTPLIPVQYPELYWPGNGYIVLSETPLMQWSEPEKAVSYYLQVATDDSFDNLVVDEPELENSYYDVPDYKFKYYALYYWRVRSVDMDGIASGWSQVYYFRVLPESLLLPSFCGCGG